jgi:hypothetical protein
LRGGMAPFRRGCSRRKWGCVRACERVHACMLFFVFFRDACACLRAAALPCNNRSVRSLPPGVATGFDYNRPRVPPCADGMQRRIRPAVVHTQLVCRICYNRVSELPFRQLKPRIVKVETVDTPRAMRTVRQVQHRANQHRGCGERRATNEWRRASTRTSNGTRRTLHARRTACVERYTHVERRASNVIRAWNACSTRGTFYVEQ